MALTPEQFERLKALKAQKDASAKLANAPAPLSPNQSINDYHATLPPESVPKYGFFAKARDFAADIIGGGKIAEGAGKAIAASGTQKALSESEKMGADIEINLIKKIRERKQAGQDTSGLESALNTLISDMGQTRKAQKDVVADLPSNKEVIGSAVKLATTAVAPSVAKGVSKLAGGGVKGGAVAGSIAGAVEGVGQGAGNALEDNKDALGVAESALGTGLVGGVIGAPLGAIGGAIAGKLNTKKTTESIFDYVTPKADQLSDTALGKLRSKGLLMPSTKKSPAKIQLTPEQQQTAIKYSDLLEKNPEQTFINISKKISELDDEVGNFLKNNNAQFKIGDLTEKLITGMRDVNDLTKDQKIIEKAKTTVIKNFVESMKTNDMHTLWEARKAFDRKIEKAFVGSESIAKEIKTEFRDIVQTFIKENTPDSVYKNYMHDMSQLIRLNSNVNIKANKDKAVSEIGKWFKENPKVAKTIGYGSGALGFGALGALGVNVVTPND